MTSKNSGLAQLGILIGLVVMAVALPVASMLVSNNQDNRNKATYNCSEVTNPTNWQQPCAYGWSCNTTTGVWVCVPSGATSVPLLPTVTKALCASDGTCQGTLGCCSGKSYSVSTLVCMSGIKCGVAPITPTPTPLCYCGISSGRYEGSCGSTVLGQICRDVTKFPVTPVASATPVNECTCGPSTNYIWQGGSCATQGILGKQCNKSNGSFCTDFRECGNGYCSGLRCVAWPSPTPAPNNTYCMCGPNTNWKWAGCGAGYAVNDGMPCNLELGASCTAHSECISQYCYHNKCTNNVYYGNPTPTMPCYCDSTGRYSGSCGSTILGTYCRATPTPVPPTPKVCAIGCNSAGISKECPTGQKATCTYRSSDNCLVWSACEGPIKYQIYSKYPGCTRPNAGGLYCDSGVLCNNDKIIGACSTGACSQNGVDCTQPQAYPTIKPGCSNTCEYQGQSKDCHNLFRKVIGKTLCEITVGGCLRWLSKTCL